VIASHCTDRSLAAGSPPGRGCATVSLVLNGQTGGAVAISDETRQRVWRSPSQRRAQSAE